jgi:CRP/FNR family transcriptional regulator, polysaccharide utilization system transcription regulator
MKKILLIEDNLEIRENIAEILGLSGYSVEQADNGKVGVEHAKARKPDLIICDIMMPELDGYGVLHILSKNPDTAAIPFVFLTAKSEKGDLRKGMMMGADDYLTKPFDDLELLNVVETRLRKSELLRKDFAGGSAFDDFVEEARNLSGLGDFSQERNTRRFKKKENLFSEGQYPAGVYHVRKGMVKTFVTNGDGKELITGIHKEGDFIGFISLLEEKPCRESAQALEETEAVLIPRDDFNNLIYNSREVSRTFIGMLSGRILEKEEQLLRLAYNSVRKRVAEALSMLYDRYRKDSPDVRFSISREDLANIVGTATESAIRTLADFREEGLIEIQKGEISVLSIEKLRKMKN